MAKNSITDYDNVANNNTDIQSVDIAENCAPSGINNAIRELMADLADVNDGTVTLTSPKAATFEVTGTLTASGLTVDTNTLYVDSTNNRVGVGTSSPEAKTSIVSSAGAIGLTVKDANAGANNYLSAQYNGTSGVADIKSQSSSGSTQLAFSTSSSGTTAERMRIDSSGNVGIGTTTPSVELEVAGDIQTLWEASSTKFIGSKYSTTYDLGMYADTDNRKLTLSAKAGDSTGTIAFQTGVTPTERMRIDSSGNVGIGTSSPTFTFGSGLEVQRAGSATVRVDNSTDAVSGELSAYNSGLLVYTLSAHPVIFGTSGGERLRIDTSGIITNIGTYNNGSASSANMVVNSSGLFLRSVSSQKYKTNIEDIEDSYAEAILNVRPVYYRSTLENDNQEHSHWGFIAEEVAEIDPRLVHYKTVETTYDEENKIVQTPLENPEPEGVQYDRFIPILLKLIQKQQQQIETLEAKVTALENA